MVTGSVAAAVGHVLCCPFCFCFVVVLAEGRRLQLRLVLSALLFSQQLGGCRLDAPDIPVVGWCTSPLRDLFLFAALLFWLRLLGAGIASARHGIPTCAAASLVPLLGLRPCRLSAPFFALVAVALTHTLSFALLAVAERLAGLPPATEAHS